MKFVVILSAVLALAMAGGDEMEMMKKWMKLKVMESCIGEDTLKSWMVKMKTVAAKCNGESAPVDLMMPMFSKTNRVLHALIKGAKETMDDQQEQLIGALANHHHHGVPAHTHESLGGGITLNLNTGSSSKDMMSMLMHKIMFMKMMQNMHGKFDDDDDEEDGPADMISSYIASGSKDDDDDFKEVMRMVKRAMKRPVRGARYRRESDDNKALFAMGEKLNEKLMAQKEKFEQKAGNYSCMLKELGVINDDMELDLDSMIKSFDEFPIQDPWLEEKLKKGARLCYSYAEAIPKEVLNESPYGEKWCKIKKFCACEKKFKYMTCMAKDVKKNLESNFGPLDKLVEETGMDEKHLLPMAAMLLKDEILNMVE